MTLQSGVRILYLGRSGGLNVTQFEQLYSSPKLVDFIERSSPQTKLNEVVLRQKYVVEGLSLKQISIEFLYSKNTIRKQLIGYGIPLRQSHKQHGRHATPRYGTKVVKGKVVSHLAEKRVVDTVIELRNKGFSFKQIADFLSKLSIPTKRKGQKWHKEVVRHIYTLAQKDSENAQVPRDKTDITSDSKHNSSPVEIRQRNS